MNIIFVGRKHGKSKTVQLINRQLIWLGVFVLLILMGLFFLGYQARVLIEEGTELSIENEIMAKWDQQLLDQAKDVRKLKRLSQEKVDALTLRMGDM